MGSEFERPVVPNNVTHRITTLLALIGRTEGGIGPREASRITGIDRSAISRIFNQLERLGWVQEVGERGTYTVGPEMFSVAAAVRERDSLGRAARPLLEMLTDRFDETSYLAVRHANHLIFEDRVDCTQRLRYVVELHEPFPLTTGAAGRAILSGMAHDEFDIAVAGTSQEHPALSPTEADDYQAQLNHDRQRGYAYSRGKWIVGSAAVASPIFDANEMCIGAIVISAPSDRLPPDTAAIIGPTVRDAARRVSNRIGYVGRPWGEGND